MKRGDWAASLDGAWVAARTERINMAIDKANEERNELDKEIEDLRKRLQDNSHHGIQVQKELNNGTNEFEKRLLKAEYRCKAVETEVSEHFD